MKIDTLPQVSLQKPSAERLGNANNDLSAKLPATPISPPVTNVSLGSTAQLKGIEANMSSAPPVNSSKVAEIKQAISEGRFKINSGIIADRLMDTVRGLIKEQA